MERLDKSTALTSKVSICRIGGGARVENQMTEFFLRTFKMFRFINLSDPTQPKPQAGQRVRSAEYSISPSVSPPSRSWRD